MLFAKMFFKKHNWEESIKKQVTGEEIVEAVRKQEKGTLIALRVGDALIIFFLIMIVLFSLLFPENISVLLLFTIASIFFIVCCAVAILIFNMNYNTLYLLYESRVRTEAEIRKSEAADL